MEKAGTCSTNKVPVSIPVLTEIERGTQPLFRNMFDTKIHMKKKQLQRVDALLKMSSVVLRIL